MSENTTGAVIELIDVTKSYPGQSRPAVDGLSLTIPAGETVMFVGPSGGGKTTSLKMINRLIEPTSGTIRIDGKDVTGVDPTQLRRTIGYVIQGGSLLPHMTVESNIVLVPKLLKWDKDKISARVDELLEMVDLDPATYRHRYPRELSGGQQQRVGVARGLAADPPVVLMDEPFGAVDPVTRQRLQDELIDIQNQLGKTIVFVTHDIDEALKLGDRLLVFGPDGRPAQFDTPENILANPANDFVADFVGSGSVLKQLTLMRIDDIGLTHPQTCHVGEATATVIDRVRAAGEESVVILDHAERPVDWAWLRSLKNSGDTITDPHLPEVLSVDHRSTLNDAMNVMLTGSHGAAMVTKRGKFIGAVSYDAVTTMVRSWQDQPEGEGQ